MHYVKPRYTKITPAEIGTAEWPNPDRSPSVGLECTALPNTRTVRSAHLDLITARLSLAVDCVGYILLSLNLPAGHFTVVSAFLALGAAGSAAMNSLTLSLLPNKSESGRLFGALAVVNALGAALISPILFGNLFAATVGTYAAAVFILAAGIVAVAQFFLLFIKLPKPDDPADTERGRNRKVKRVNSTAFPKNNSRSRSRREIRT